MRRQNLQWWWYTVRRNGYHDRTYMKKSDAVGYATVSQKIRGGTWCVYRERCKWRHDAPFRRLIATFEGVRNE